MSTLIVPRSHSLVVLACIAVAPGCIETDGEDEGFDMGEPLPDHDPCTAADGLELTFIEDFEDGTADDFTSNSDTSANGMLEPPSSLPSPPAVQIDVPRCDEDDDRESPSEFAYHLTASGLIEWGASFAYAYPAEDPFYAQDFDGIVFWARHGENSGRSMFVQLNQPSTTPGFSECEYEPDDPANSCDAFGWGVGLSEDWRFFKLPFAELSQRGFGRAEAEYDLAALLGFQFGLERGRWDIWLDDLAYYVESD